jgi:hypothetical protein
MFEQNLQTYTPHSHTHFFTSFFAMRRDFLAVRAPHCHGKEPVVCKWLRRLL